MADYENRSIFDFFPMLVELGRRDTKCRLCGAVPPDDATQQDHARYHNDIDRRIWELQEQLKGLTAWHSGDQPKCLCGTLDNGDAVVDRHGWVWTVTRDGGMVVRPAQESVHNIFSGGLHWLEMNHGPITVVWRKVDSIEAEMTTGTFTIAGSDAVHRYGDTWSDITSAQRNRTTTDKIASEILRDQRRAELNKEPF